MNQHTIQTHLTELNIFLEKIEVCKKSLWARLTFKLRSKIKSATYCAIELLKNLESIPVEFPLNSLESEQLNQIPYKNILEAIRALLLSLGHYSHGEIYQLKLQLKQNFVALLYRLEKCNEGLDSIAAADTAQITKVIEKALHYKKTSPILIDKNLNEEEKNKMEETCQYPAFTTLLLEAKTLQEAFFTWTLRDKNEPTAFILFPGLQEKIVACNLSGRIGRFKGKMLRILKEKIVGRRAVKKIVTLPFEGKNICILDENFKVVLRNNWSLTIKEVFEIFKNKFKNVGNLEFFARGISNWNCHDWGFWNPEKKSLDEIDLTKKNWWQQLPVFEILSTEEAKLRFGPHIDGKIWNVSAVSTRNTTTLNYDGCHSFLEMAIPDKNGNYYIYDFGKFAKQFSTSVFENLRLFCYNLYATISYPDENVFYTHRQSAYHSFPITFSEGLLFLEGIRKDIVLGRADNFVYQIESENCAKWLNCHLEAVLGKESVPNLYRTSLLKTEPKGVMAFVFKIIRALPLFCQIPTLMYMHIPFGATEPTWIIEKGESVPKALHLADFWITGEVFLPAYLHRKQELGHFSYVNRSSPYHTVALRLLPASLALFAYAVKGYWGKILHKKVPAKEIISQNKTFRKLLEVINNLISSLFKLPKLFQFLPLKSFVKIFS